MFVTITTHFIAPKQYEFSNGSKGERAWIRQAFQFLSQILKTHIRARFRDAHIHQVSPRELTRHPCRFSAEFDLSDHRALVRGLEESFFSFAQLPRGAGAGLVRNRRCGISGWRLPRCRPLRRCAQKNRVATAPSKECLKNSNVKVGQFRLC